MSGDEVERCVDEFHKMYDKCVLGTEGLIPGTEGLIRGTEEAVMIAISTFVLRKSGILSEIEHRANKFMSILTAWNAIKKARIEAAKAAKARIEADEADKARIEADEADKARIEAEKV